MRKYFLFFVKAIGLFALMTWAIASAARQRDFKHCYLEDTYNNGEQEVCQSGVADSLNSSEAKIYRHIKKNTAAPLFDYQRKELVHFMNYVRKNPKSNCRDVDLQSKTVLICSQPNGQQAKSFDRLSSHDLRAYFPKRIETEDQRTANSEKNPDLSEDQKTELAEQKKKELKKRKAYLRYLAQIRKREKEKYYKVVFAKSDQKLIRNWSQQLKGGLQAGSRVLASPEDPKVEDSKKPKDPPAN